MSSSVIEFDIESIIKTLKRKEKLNQTRCNQRTLFRFTTRPPFLVVTTDLHVRLNYSVTTMTEQDQSTESDITRSFAFNDA